MKVAHSNFFLMMSRRLALGYLPLSLSGVIRFLFLCSSSSPFLVVLVIFLFNETKKKSEANKFDQHSFVIRFDRSAGASETPGVFD